MPTTALLAFWMDGWVEGSPPGIHAHRGDLILNGAHDLAVRFADDLALSGATSLAVGASRSRVKLDGAHDLRVEP